MNNYYSNINTGLWQGTPANKKKLHLGVKCKSKLWVKGKLPMTWKWHTQGQYDNLWLNKVYDSVWAVTQSHEYLLDDVTDECCTQITCLVNCVPIWQACLIHAHKDNTSSHGIWLHYCCIYLQTVTGGSCVYGVKALITLLYRTLPPSGCSLWQFHGISRPAGKRRQTSRQLWGIPPGGASEI